MLKLPKESTQKLLSSSSLFWKILEFFKDLLAPKKCYGCQVHGTFLCEKCLKKIGKYPCVCPVCKEKTRGFLVHFYCENSHFFLHKVCILGVYRDSIMKSLIRDAKFHHRKDIFLDLAPYLGDFLQEYLDVPDEEVLLVPTPMYFWKKWMRGYNQSEILVQLLALHTGLNYHLSIIKKSKSTRAQSHLTKLQRKQNLQGVFVFQEVCSSIVSGKTIIIVDDVVSTGSTLNELAKLYHKHWAARIYGLCLASD